MRRFFTLLNREIGSFFHQPMAYVVLLFLLVITGLNFHAGVSALNRETSQVTVVGAFFNSILFWFPFVLVFPLLTMRLFSEEYKLGTIEPLMTAPVRDFQVVLAKFLGAVLSYLVLWAPSLAYFAIFQLVSGQAAAGAIGSYFGAYLLLVLAGLFYLSLGCLASSLTNNQIAAAAISFSLICLAFFISLLSHIFIRASFLSEFSYYFSTIEHMAEFSSGVFDTRPMVFYLSMTALVLFLTLHVFQYRRWKS